MVACQSTGSVNDRDMASVRRDDGADNRDGIAVAGYGQEEVKDGAAGEGGKFQRPLGRGEPARPYNTFVRTSLKSARFFLPRG